MTSKQLTLGKMITAFVLALVAGNAVITNNYLMLAIAFAAAISAILIMRSKVSEIVADERDYALGGVAARWTIQIYAWFSVMLMLILFSQRTTNPSFEPIATTLAYSTCFLMVLYAMIFRYHQKLKFMAKQKMFLALGSIIVLVLILFGIRLLSGEDNWICENGKWIKHGKPSFPAPQTECR